MTSPTMAVRPSRPRPGGAFYLRAFVSMMMIASLLAFVVSGVALFVAPSGQLAHTIGWRVLGVDKGQWEALHVAFGFLWMPLAVVHLLYNRRVVTGYLRDRVRKAYVWRRELVAALAVTAFLGVASVLDLPPVVQLMHWEESFNAFWAERSSDVVVTIGGAGRVEGVAGERGPGMGRYATVDPHTGENLPVGKEAAARIAALAEAESEVTTDGAEPVR